jgi:hypothetical protein
MKKFWKGLISNLGLIVLIGGISFLSYIVYTQIQTNLTLGISAGLIVGGLLLYILLNKIT